MGEGGPAQVLKSRAGLPRLLHNQFSRVVSRVSFYFGSRRKKER